MKRLYNSLDNSHIFSSCVLFELEFLFRILMGPSAAFRVLPETPMGHDNKFFTSYLKIHQFSHNHGKLKCPRYCLHSLGSCFCYNHILYLFFSLRLRIAKTSSGNRLLHAMCTSLASHLLIRDTVIVSRKRLIIRIGFQVRERHIKLLPISSVGVADP
jgi:hypothetical protein